jgi:hypothetical protein
MKWKYSIIFLFLLTAMTSSYAQREYLGTWNILNFRYTWHEKWSVFTEGQVRSLHFYDHFHYHEMTAGLIFRPHRQVAITLAVGDYDTYREGGDFLKPKNNDEFRIWPQVAFSQSLGRVRIEHRYRSEQRFTINGFRLRFRSRVGILVPLNHAQLEDGTWFLNCSNELFFTTKEAYFERDRFLAVLGHRLSPRLTAHIGYVHQFDYRINDEIGRDFFQVSVQVEARKK